MTSLREDVADFRKQLAIGSMQRSYRALLSFMLDLRTHFTKRWPACAVSGLYQGYMDMTYFAIVPPPLKHRDMKVAIVFNYEAFRFEAWLAGSNRKVQQRYRELVKTGRWDGCRVVAPAKGVDSIIECDLAEGFDVDDLASLIAEIDDNATKFIQRVETFLSERDGE